MTAPRPSRFRLGGTCRRGRGRPLDGDAERLTDPGQALAAVAEIAQGRSAEPAVGQLAQHRDDALGIVGVGWRDLDRQRDAILLDRHLDLDAADLLAAINAARE